MQEGKKIVTFENFSKTIPLQRSKDLERSSRILYATHIFLVLSQIFLVTTAATVQTPFVTNVVKERQLHIDLSITTVVTGFFAAFLTTLTHVVHLDRLALKSTEAAIEIRYFYKTKASMNFETFLKISEAFAFTKTGSVENA